MENFDLFVAMEKLNEEMSVEHTQTEDLIHNYLCDELESSPELVAGVLKPDRSIKGAMQYCTSKAYNPLFLWRELRFRQVLVKVRLKVSRLVTLLSQNQQQNQKLKLLTKNIWLTVN